MRAPNNRTPRRPQRPGGDGRNRQSVGSSLRPNTPNVPARPPSISFDDDVVPVAQVSASSAAQAPNDVVDVNPHLAEKKAEKRRTRRNTILRTAGIMCATIGLIWFIFFNPLWALQKEKIRVEGLNEHTVTTAEEIITFVAGSEGTPITRLSTRAVGKEILATFPEIENVDIRRVFRNGLRVNLTARQPIACIVKQDGCDGTDRSGQIFPVKEDIAAGLPRISLASIEEAQEGKLTTQETQQRRKTTVAAVDVLLSLSDEIRGMVTSLSVDHHGRVTLVLTTGKNVVWGDMSHPDLKSQALKALVNEPGSRVDISEPTAALVY